MSIRTSVHALVDELGEHELELAKQVLEDIHAGAFDLSDEERADLSVRIDECNAGDSVDARAFLSSLRTNDDLARR